MLVLILAAAGFFAYVYIKGQLSASRCQREKLRWQEVVALVPELVYPAAPDFSASQYTVRGLHYDQWLAEFKSWSHSYIDGFCGSRNVTGKRYVREDAKWHRFFDEWQRTVYIPAVVQINADMKRKSEARWDRLVEVYSAKFGVAPAGCSVPEVFRPLPEQTSIPRCYKWCSRMRRNLRV